MKKLFLMALPCIMAVSTLQAIKIDSLQNNTNSDIKYIFIEQPYDFDNPPVLSNFSVLKMSKKINLSATDFKKGYVQILYGNKLFLTIKLADLSSDFAILEKENFLNPLKGFWPTMTAKKDAEVLYDTFTIVIPKENEELLRINPPYIIGNKEKTAGKSNLQNKKVEELFEKTLKDLKDLDLKTDLLSPQNDRRVTDFFTMMSTNQAPLSESTLSEKPSTTSQQPKAQKPYRSR